MDTPATSAAPGAAPATQPADLLPLARDLQNDIALVTAVVQAVKAQGALAGITSQAPAIVAAVQKDVKDVEAALPAVKATPFIPAQLAKPCQSTSMPCWARCSPSIPVSGRRRRKGFDGTPARHPTHTWRIGPLRVEGDQRPPSAGRRSQNQE